MRIRTRWQYATFVIAPIIFVGFFTFRLCRSSDGFLKGVGYGVIMAVLAIGWYFFVEVFLSEEWRLITGERAYFGTSLLGLVAGLLIAALATGPVVLGWYRPVIFVTLALLGFGHSRMMSWERTHERLHERHAEKLRLRRLSRTP